MIKPALQGEAFLADVQARRERPGFRAWWLGQSGFLVQYAGRHILLDPYLSDSLTVKYAQTDKPHVRMTELVVDPAKLDFIDVVTSSHNHTDHLDRDTLLPVIQANPSIALIIPSANRAFVAERLGCDPAWPLGLADGESAQIGDFRFTAVPAAHEKVDRQYSGYIVGFGGYRLYHPGDTVLYDGMVERLKPYRVDLAFLPINGSLPERRVAGNLWGREAAWLAHEIGAKLVVPCHYDMFTFNTESPDEFVAECERLNQPHQVLRCGQCVEINGT